MAEYSHSSAANRPSHCRSRARAHARRLARADWRARGKSGGCLPLFHDGTERPIPRPKNTGEQKDYWSGKAHDHTVKNIILADRSATIWFLSDTIAGASHEKHLADTMPYPLPTGSELLQDIGFLGFSLPEVTITMPHKKPKGQTLTAIQKAHNRVISRRRVRIEHIISAVKRCCIVKDDIRLRADHMRDTVMEICCALHNLRLMHAPWKPAH